MYPDRRSNRHRAELYRFAQEEKRFHHATNPTNKGAQRSNAASEAPAIKVPHATHNDYQSKNDFIGSWFMGSVRALRGEQHIRSLERVRVYAQGL